MKLRALFDNIKKGKEADLFFFGEKTTIAKLFLLLHKIMLKWFSGVISKLDIFGKKSIFQDISETSERTLNIL